MALPQHPPDADPTIIDLNIVPFVRKGASPEYQAPLTFAELREIREMLAYHRATRPKLEGLFTGCPTARRMLEEG